jgi:hypothetical protein
MNAANNGTDSRREALFAEIAELKRQRNDCQAALAECQRQNRELRAQLEGDR